MKYTKTFKDFINEGKILQDKDHEITQAGNTWVLIYKNKHRIFKHHFGSEKEAEEFWNNKKESLNEAASIPSNIMSFAKRKSPYAVALVKKAAGWAEKAGKYISGGTAIGKNYSTIILDMKYQGAEIYINLDDETIELFGEEVTDPKSFKKVLDANNANKSILNEGRSIEKIEKDRTGIINDMAETVTNWKASKSSGDKEAEASFLLRLKDLTAKKNNLEKELTSAVSGKDRFIELIISEKLNESAMSDIDLLAKESKDFKTFVKAFQKEYSNLDAGSFKELKEWLKTVYDSAKENMDESLVNEGQFSWMAQDTGNQIGSEKQNTIAVTMFDDKGNKWLERSYDGYGEFGGKDYYELLAQMNGVENANRNDGIDLAFGKTKVKGKLLFPALIENPNRFNSKRHDFTQEPKSDPNQSWYQEDEDYNESAVTKDVVINIKELGKGFSIFGNIGNVYSNTAHAYKSGQGNLCGTPALSSNHARNAGIEEVGCLNCLKEIERLKLIKK